MSRDANPTERQPVKLCNIGRTIRLHAATGTNIKWVCSSQTVGTRTLTIASVRRTRRAF